MGTQRLISEEDILSQLNPQQREAVLATEGPVLVIAGAGSGKTRVLTYRIAYLVGVKGVPPENILAVTFTNKAADEMKERVKNLLRGVAELSGLWVGTFHSMCVRMMRPFAERIGYKPNFTIYDKEDQIALLKEILSDYSDQNPRTASSVISKMKNLEGYEPEDDRFYYIYQAYQNALLEQNAMDFDDLILNAIKLLRENPDVRLKYAERFRYIHVDEYQDTNRPQYHLLVLLSSVHRNLFVVGDEDQCIYSFRGANINNILGYEEDFPDCRVFKLERNYRSTKKILAAANAVIVNNTQRRGKTLWTENPPGANVLVIPAEDERDEALRVAEKIREFLEEGFTLSDIAVLYRTNAQSRAFEEVLSLQGLRYEMRGALKFYERKEVKDILAYMRLIVNPRDDVSLRRIINVPQRGIGKRTMDRIAKLVEELRPEHPDICTREVISRPRLLETLDIKPYILVSLSNFNSLMTELEALGPDAGADVVIKSIVEKTGYREHLFTNYPTDEAEERWENVLELMGTVEDYVKSADDISLKGFLSTVSVRTELDETGSQANAVTLMTSHAAKGTEFPIVFVTGLEDGIFPHHSSKEDGSYEEERRLFYVSMTRAMKHLVITYARRRYIRRGMNLQPSPFLRELPEEVTEWANKNAEMAVRMVKEEDFYPGQRVRHSKFGRGIVLESYDGKILVDFGGAGIRTIVKDFLRLEGLNPQSE
ncbi:MAG: UvrD-helicase domain-containing protein [candidate division WOR-3 bacterium]